MILLTSGTVAAATLDLVLTTYTSYYGFKLFADLLPATNATELWSRFSTDGGSSYNATGYSYVEHWAVDDGTSGLSNSGSAAQIKMAGNIGSATTEGIYIEATLLNPTSTDRHSRIQWISGGRNSDITPATSSSRGVGAREAAQDTDAWRLMFSSGDITSGNYRLYGIL